jgi:hypothetical protein
VGIIKYKHIHRFLIAILVITRSEYLVRWWLSSLFASSPFLRRFLHLLFGPKDSELFFNSDRYPLVTMNATEVRCFLLRASRQFAPLGSGQLAFISEFRCRVNQSLMASYRKLGMQIGFRTSSRRSERYVLRSKLWPRKARIWLRDRIQNDLTIMLTDTKI